MYMCGQKLKYMPLKSILFFSSVEEFFILFCALSIINKGESAHATPAENRITQL